MEVQQLLPSARPVPGLRTGNRPKSTPQHGRDKRSNCSSRPARGQTPRGSRPKSAAPAVSGSRVPTAQMDPKGYAPPFHKVERGRWKLHSDMTYKVSYWDGAVTTTYGLSYVHPQELVEMLRSKPAEGVTPNASKAEALKKFAELKKSLQDRRAAKNATSSQQVEEQTGSDWPSGPNGELAVEGCAAPEQMQVVDEAPDGDVRCSTSWQRPKSASARPDTTSTVSTFAPPRTPGRPQSARTSGTCTPPSTSWQQRRPQSAVSDAQVDWAAQNLNPFGGHRLQPTVPCPDGATAAAAAGTQQQRQRTPPTSGSFHSHGRSYPPAHALLMKDDSGRFCYKWP